MDSEKKKEKLTAHDKYTEAYVGILEAYKNQMVMAVKKKNDLKQLFFNSIKLIMYTMVFTFSAVLMASIIIMGVMIFNNYNAPGIIVNSLVAIVSSFVTMVLGIYKLPQIIADYLFNKEEDKQMQEIIENIQKYELNADMAERMRDQANVDAAMNNMISHLDKDSEIDDSDYRDSTMVSNASTDSLKIDNYNA